MALFERADVARMLADLFDRERRAILGGQFDDLGRLAPDKERLLKAAGRARVSADALAALQVQAERNGNLLKAMADGVRAAVGQIERLRGKPAALHTYDARGRRHEIAPAPGRRALGQRT